MGNVRNKQRLIRLYRYLYENTDEEHQVSTNDLVDLFRSEEASASRKTVKDDIDILRGEGYDIVINKTYHNSFFLASRELDVEEVKILIDAVASSRFITMKKSQELIDKLKKLVSRYQAEKLSHNLYTAGRMKPDNERIYITVNKINDAINEGRQIRFQYLDYDGYKHKVLKHDGEYYYCSPYCLVWDGDHYYMVCWSEKHGKIGHFRVDRIASPEILEDRNAVPLPEGYDISSEVQREFSMFEGSEKQVVLEVKDELMKDIVDKFGENVTTWRASEDSFFVRARVSASPTFYSWVFQFGGKIRIEGPGDAREEYCSMLKEAMPS